MEQEKGEPPEKVLNKLRVITTMPHGFQNVQLNCNFEFAFLFTVAVVAIEDFSTTKKSINECFFWAEMDAEITAFCDTFLHCGGVSC